MATRMKTVQYAFPALASLVNNTLTNLTQITIALPENAKVFRSVVARISCDDIVTATGGTITTKTFALRLGAAAYTTRSSLASTSNTGENISLHWVAGFADHFAANWTGSSMTCDFQVLVNQTTGTTLGMVNVCVTLEITYEHDDTSATKVKTIYYPLNCPSADMNTAPSTLTTIPALNTLLPEAGKAFRSIHVVTQGIAGGTNTTDHTMTLRVGSASVTTGNYEAGLQSNRFTRYVWDLTGSYPSTAVSQAWQPTASSTLKRYHQQAWLVVTYEYTEATTTNVFNSVWLQQRVDLVGPLDAATIFSFNLGVLPDKNPVGVAAALYLEYQQLAAAINTITVRYNDPTVGEFATINYTDNAPVPCGTNALMAIRNGVDLEFSDGNPALFEFEIHETSAANHIRDAAASLLVCWTSEKSAQGTEAHLHTVKLNLFDYGVATNTPFNYDSANLRVLSDNFADAGLEPEPFAAIDVSVRTDLFLQVAPSVGAVKFMLAEDAANFIGPKPLCTWGFEPFAEMGYYTLCENLLPLFKISPYDAGFLRDLDGSNPYRLTNERKYRLTRQYGSNGTTANTLMAATMFVTMHHMYVDITGTLTGATGSVQVEGQGTAYTRDVDYAVFVPEPATAYTIRNLSPRSPFNLTALDSTGKTLNGVWTPPP